MKNSVTSLSTAVERNNPTPLAYTLKWVRRDGTVKAVDYSAFIIAILNWLFLYLKGYKNAVVINNKTTVDPVEHARANGLIRKVKPDGTLVEYTRLSKSELKRWLDSNNIVPYDTFVKVDATVNPYEKDQGKKAKALGQIWGALNGKLVLDGEQWLPIMQSASDRRKGCYVACVRPQFGFISERIRCGVDLAAIYGAAAKSAFIYPSLCMSMSDENPVQVKWNRIAIVKDCNLKLDPQWAKHVAGNNIMRRVLKDDEPLNVFDGFELRIVNDKSKIKPYQGRDGFAAKGFADVVERQWLLDNYGPEINTMFGPMKIKDIDLVLTESSAKFLGYFGAPNQWSEACKKYRVKQAICGTTHKPVLKGLPYQQGQLLKGTKAEAILLAHEGYESFKEWLKAENAYKLLTGSLRNAVELYPALLKTRHFQKLMNDKAVASLEAMVEGELPDCTLQFHVAPDLRCFLDYIYGKDMTEWFEKDQAVCLDLEVGMRVVVTRNPATDGIPEVEIVWGDPALYNEHILYINPLSWIPIWLRLDYDGDKVKVIVKKLLVEIARRTRKVYGDDPITFEQPKAQKVKITRKDLVDAIMASVYGSRVGVLSDDLTRLLNASLDDIQFLMDEYGENIIQELHAVLTKMINVDIDSAKNAEETAEMDPRVKEALEYVHNLPMPAFAGRYKIGAGRWDSQKYIDKSEYTGSFLEMFADRILEMAAAEYGYEFDIRKNDETEDRKAETKTDAKFQITGLEGLTFNYQDLMIDPEREMKGYIGLARTPDKDKEGRYVNQGLFNNIAFRHKVEWAMLGKLDGVEKIAEREALKEASLKEIEEFVKYQGGDLDGAYDVITRWFFTHATKMSDEGYEQVARAYYDIFGDKLVSVLALKFGFGDMDNDSEEVDEDLPW